MKFVHIVYILSLLCLTLQKTKIAEAKKVVHIPDELDDVVDDEEDEEWKEWGKPKSKIQPFDPPPDFTGMDPSKIQAEVLKRHSGPSIGFVKLRLDEPRTREEVPEIAKKWTRLLRTGSIEAKFMAVDVNFFPCARHGGLCAFTAMQKGIFVSCSAGNSGPDQMSVQNVAPWITTVGASTLDRDFPGSLVLGNRVRFNGVSLYRGRGLRRGKLFPIIYASNGTNGSDLCLENSLDPKLVKDKIVMCDRGTNARVQKGFVVKSAGGVGMILSNTEDSGEDLAADSHILPAIAVGFKARESIKKYIKENRARATIQLKGTVLDTTPAPVVAGFSSRGPNFLTPQILKPDIVAPGVNILAAWTGAAAPSNLDMDKRRVKFNIISGTSMSCPHVSGIAALIKDAHPDWSPAAIRSALITTAYSLDNTGKPLKDAATGFDSTPFAHGAGHVDPNRALNPGLIYDMGVQDYVDFLCSLNYTAQQLKIIANSNVSCSSNAYIGNINYPSFSAVFSDSNTSSAQVLKYMRTVTNVEDRASTYKVAVSAPAGVSITVSPTTLSFAKVNEKLSYTVTFTTATSALPPTYGSITWSNGVHNVRSPVAAFSWQA